MTLTPDAVIYTCYLLCTISWPVCEQSYTAPCYILRGCDA